MRCLFRLGLSMGCSVLKPKPVDCLNVCRMRWDDTMSLLKLPGTSPRRQIDCSGKMDVLDAAGFTRSLRKNEKSRKQFVTKHTESEP